jgi:putative MATE family efflux protein
MQVVNTLLDRGFIGHLPIEALTAHGGSTNVMFLMFSLAVSIATGATALVSRAYGAGERREYRKASRESFAVAVLFGIILAVATAIVSPFAARAILPAKDLEAIRQMTAFCLAYATGLPAICVIQTLAGSLRGIGDTKSPMVISGLQILLHIVLNYLLIFPSRDLGWMRLPGAGLGLVGAAMALSASAWVSAVIYVAYVRRTKLGAMSFRLPETEYTKRILRIAVPAAMMATLRVLSLTAFTLALALVPRGSEAIAAMTLGFSIESIMFMPSFGLSAAAGALVGQSLGMQRPDRAERLAWTAGHYAAAVTICLAVPIYFGAPAIASALLNEKTFVIRETVVLLRYLCVTELFFAYAMVMIGAMQGAGDTVRPMWISVFALWGLRVPFAFFFALEPGQPLGQGLTMPVGLGLGADGAWMAMALTQGIQGVMAMILFKQGAWKTKKV